MTDSTIVAKYQVGDRVEVSTRPANRPAGNGQRCREGFWGFGPDEWRPATISTVHVWPTRVSYTVQFRPEDAHWGFEDCEIRPAQDAGPAEPIHGEDLPMPDYYQTHHGIQGDRW